MSVITMEEIILGEYSLSGIIYKAPSFIYPV